MVSRKRVRPSSTADNDISKEEVEEEFVSISEFTNKNSEKSKKKPSKKQQLKSSSKFEPQEEEIDDVITAAAAEHHHQQQRQQRSLFVNHYQSANAIKLSPLELASSFSDSSFLNLSESLPQDVSNLSEHIKASFGSSWEEKLCKKELPDKESEPGSPVLLTISLSALRSLELLRSLRPFTKECPAAKLFSKHIKVEEQVSFLKSHHVNIACGTPSRIKKLIDMEALGLSRLAIIVLDMQTDVKGYSLFTLRQVRDEFWDLYKTYFHQQLLKGGLRICLYGGTTADAPMKEK